MRIAKTQKVQAHTHVPCPKCADCEAWLKVAVATYVHFTLFSPLFICLCSFSSLETETTRV